METKNKVLCIDCISWPLCQNRNQYNELYIGVYLNSIANKCNILKEYLSLKDMGLEMPESDADFEHRIYFTIPQAIRVKKFSAFMRVPRIELIWLTGDLDRWRKLKKSHA